MARTANSFQQGNGKYEMVPPEGGWGYAVMLGVSLIFTVTIVPASFFGTVFGPFVASLGDEISATALILGVFNTTLFLTGLPSNYLLQKYSYRRVAAIGAILYFIGSFLAIFAQTIFQLLAVYGIMQGIGFGFLVSSGFAALHEYFVQKENFVMSICHTIIGAMGMIWPIFTSKLMADYGFRGTAAIFSALSLHLILAASIFQPAKWHYRRKQILIAEKESFIPTLAPVNDTQELPEGGLLKKDPANFELDESNSVGAWQSIVNSLDLVLFKDPCYVNLTLGTSMAMTSDVLFLSIIPAILTTYGFDDSEQTIILTVFFSADLVGRAFLSIVNGVFRIYNRYVVLMGAVLTTILRVAFTLNYSFWWTILISAALGSLRCTIQVTFSLVFAEKYGHRYVTAFSLNMVVTGIVVLTVGILSGWVKDLTGSDIMVVHLLTLIYSICAASWSVEILCSKIVKMNT
ncbi:hypothetical protein Trydic_g9762 [Trypoxylus dichotomus]